MVKRMLKGVLLAVFGVGILAAAVLGPFSTYQDVQSHATTEAEIISAGIESDTELDEGEQETEYYPRIEYEYSVDGTDYSGERVFHSSQVNNEPGELRGKEFDARDDAADVVTTYEAGTDATLYYDPADPSVSYLEDPSSSLLLSTGVMVLFGLIAGGAGIGGAVGIVELE